MSELTVIGFTIGSHEAEMSRACTELVNLLNDGKLKVREKIYDGIEKMYDAFVDLYRGDQIDKIVVKA